MKAFLIFMSEFLAAGNAILDQTANEEASLFFLSYGIAAILSGFRFFFPLFFVTVLNSDASALMEVVHNPRLQTTLIINDLSILGLVCVVSGIVTLHCRALEKARGDDRVASRHRHNAETRDGMDSSTPFPITRNDFNNILCVSNAAMQLLMTTDRRGKNISEIPLPWAQIIV
jgi:hypothetical protein